MESESLKDKTVKGTAWSFIDSIAGQGISFIIGLVLANILPPEEYGLIAIIMIFIAILLPLTDSGFSNALTRKSDVTRVDYNTVFLFNLGISIILFLLFYLSAPLIATFFKQPELVNLCRAMASIVVINAFTIVQRTRLIKAIDFKTQTKISLFTSILSGGVGIVMALKGFGVWSLAVQQILKYLLSALLYWFYSDWRPQLEFSKESFQELFGFGYKILLGDLIRTFWQQINEVIIGRFYSAATLGLYARAQHFSSIIANNLTLVIQRVSYPVLSTIKDESDRLLQTYGQIIKATICVSAISMLGICAISKSLILTLIGEKWLASVEYLQIICFSAMFYPLHAINISMLQVKGRSDIFLKLELVKKSIGVGALLLGIFIGVKSMLWAWVVLNVVEYILNGYYVQKFYGYTLKAQTLDILPTFGVAGTMAVLLYALSFLSMPSIYMLLLQLVTGALLVVVLSHLFNYRTCFEIKKLFFSLLKKKKDIDKI